MYTRKHLEKSKVERKKKKLKKKNGEDLKKFDWNVI